MKESKQTPHPEVILAVIDMFWVVAGFNWQVKLFAERYGS